MENDGIIELAREIGHRLQNNDSYIKFRLAEQYVEQDKELQELIDVFNNKRSEITAEASKAERDQEKIAKYNVEMRSAYAKIISNENMIKYNEAKEDLNMLLTRVNAIIQKSSEGEDPDTADYIPSDCTGSCSSCSGCR